MKVVLPEKNPFRKIDILIYVSIFIICLVSIGIAFYVQFFVQGDYGAETIASFGKKTEEQSQLLKAEFDTIFTNSIQVTEEPSVIKKDAEKPIVFTSMQKKESKLNSYDIEVNIPEININNEEIEKCNKEIKSLFQAKAEQVLGTENKNIIYNVGYVANIEDNILSLMIHCNLKEGSNAQRVVVQAYNYDLKNNKEITLEEVLSRKQLDIAQTQEKINNEIRSEQKKVEDLKNLGYNIYERDVTSDIYKIQNSKEFYLTDNTLYIVYAYGNDVSTSELDLIVI